MTVFLSAVVIVLAIIMGILIFDITGLLHKLLLAKMLNNSKNDISQTASTNDTNGSPPYPIGNFVQGINNLKKDGKDDNQTNESYQIIPILIAHSRVIISKLIRRITTPIDENRKNDPHPLLPMKRPNSGNGGNWGYCGQRDTLRGSTVFSRIDS